MAIHPCGNAIPNRSLFYNLLSPQEPSCHSLSQPRQEASGGTTLDVLAVRERETNHLGKPRVTGWSTMSLQPVVTPLVSLYHLL
jgi:hypothetical protein